jgi:hypothetical protein
VKGDGAAGPPHEIPDMGADHEERFVTHPDNDIRPFSRGDLTLWGRISARK